MSKKGILIRTLLAMLIATAALQSCKKESEQASEDSVEETGIAEQFEQRLLNMEREQIKITVLEDGSIYLSADGIGISIPLKWQDNLPHFPLYMDDKETGYLALERFQNPDYSEGIYFVVHFHDTPVTLSYYDNISIFDYLATLIGWD